MHKLDLKTPSKGSQFESDLVKFSEQLPLKNGQDNLSDGEPYPPAK